MSRVVRYSKGWPPSGDFMSVDGREFETRALSELEHRRAAVLDPTNPTKHIRPMFYTGAPYADELLALAEEGR